MKTDMITIQGRHKTEYLPEFEYKERIMKRSKLTLFAIPLVVLLLVAGAAWAAENSRDKSDNGNVATIDCPMLEDGTVSIEDMPEACIDMMANEDGTYTCPMGESMEGCMKMMHGDMASRHGSGGHHMMGSDDGDGHSCPMLDNDDSREVSSCHDADNEEVVE
jgi:hypothetical protein